MTSSSALSLAFFCFCLFVCFSVAASLLQSCSAAVFCSIEHLKRGINIFTRKCHTHIIVYLSIYMWVGACVHACMLVLFSIIIWAHKLFCVQKLFPKSSEREREIICYHYYMFCGVRMAFRIHWNVYNKLNHLTNRILKSFHILDNCLKNGAVVAAVAT